MRNPGFENLSDSVSVDAQWLPPFPNDLIPPRPRPSKDLSVRQKAYCSAAINTATMRPVHRPDHRIGK